MHSLVASCWVSSLFFSLLLASCFAYPYKNFHEARDYDLKDVRNLDGIDSTKQGDARVEKRDVHYMTGGGNLLRDLNYLRDRAASFERQARNFPNLDSLSGITLGGEKRSWADPFNGNDKRNMDEIDHAGFDSFVKKRGFDEIDNVGFDGFVKRNLDEIDRVGFGTFIKRNAGAYPTSNPRK